MSAHALRPSGVELADIVRAHADQLTGLSGTQRQVLQAITACRTAALGGHRRACAQCGHQEIAYNSCRDRHCPKCQGLEAARWMDAQQRDLLPVPYFHVVFTVPAELHALFLAAPKATYPLLFAAVAETLTQVARRRLGAQIAVTAILHTWTQLLLFHPHLHCIVPGGGLDPGHTHWIAARADFFLPVRVLAEVFRGKLLAKLETAIDRATIPARRDDDPHDQLKRAAAKRWVVYCKPPFAGPDQVLAYLARYTHRIALLQRPVGLPPRGAGHVPLEGPRARQRPPRRHPGGRGLSAPLSAARPARPLRAHPPLWLAGQRRAQAAPAHGARAADARGPRCPHAPTVEPEPWEATLLRLTGKDVTRCPWLRGGGIPHRRSAPRARGGAGRLPPARQKPMSDSARPRPRAHGREPEAPATRHRCVRRRFEGRNGFSHADPPSPFHALGRAIAPAPCHPMPSHRPASETDRAPPIPIAGVPFRSTRPFHASRDRVPSSFLLGGATREKALFIIGRWSRRHSTLTEGGSRASRRRG